MKKVVGERAQFSISDRGKGSPALLYASKLRKSVGSKFENSKFSNSSLSCQQKTDW